MESLAADELLQSVRVGTPSTGGTGGAVFHELLQEKKLDYRHVPTTWKRGSIKYPPVAARTEGGHVPRKVLTTTGLHPSWVLLIVSETWDEKCTRGSRREGQERQVQSAYTSGDERRALRSVTADADA